MKFRSLLGLLVVRGLALRGMVPLLLFRYFLIRHLKLKIRLLNFIYLKSKILAIVYSEVPLQVEATK